MERELTDHARHNEIYWSNKAGDQVEPGRRSWREPEPSWGIWHIPEADVGALPDAEDVPLPDASFDFALSEYGASLWCDPDRWIPEAARLLRPGGRLVFLTNSALHELQAPAGATSRYDFVTPEWARRWPSEEIWVAVTASG